MMLFKPMNYLILETLGMEESGLKNEESKVNTLFFSYNTLQVSKSANESKREYKEIIKISLICESNISKN